MSISRGHDNTRLQLRRAVTMVRASDSGNDPSVDPAEWVVHTPDGGVLDVTGTTTQGLQEAINYAAQYGWALHVFGGGIKPEVFGVPYGGALGTDPFATVNTSAVVTVTHSTHGLTTGKKVYFQGLSGAVNGIPAAEFGVEHAITVVDPNSYTVTLTTPATSTGSGGGANVRFQHSGQDVSIISCTTGITFPPLQLAEIDINATINFGGSPAGPPPAINFDSVMASRIRIRGQIVVVGTSYASGLQFKPTLELGQDPNGPVITSSSFDIPSVAISGGSIPCIVLDASTAPIGDGNRWEFIEPNGGTIGIKVINGASSGFAGNRVVALDVHGQAVCIDAGTDTNASNQKDNTWVVECDPAAAGTGVKIWGRQESWDISVANDEGTVSVGIVRQSTEQSNVIVVRSNEATTRITDSATTKSSRVLVERSSVRAHKGGTNQTGIVTATYTDVTFATEVIDTLGEFASPTFTAKHAGSYSISARVAWVIGADNALELIRILKNGTGVAESGFASSGTGGGMGPTVSAVIELAEGDTVKIQARQDSGVNQDINGTAAATWLSICRI